MASNRSGPVSSSQGWGLRSDGLVMGHGLANDVREFTGMWGLKADADPEQITQTLAADWFLPQTAKLALIRTARWFIVKTPYFEHENTLFFVTQFDGTLTKYFDDFVLNGKEHLASIWGQCINCPEGDDVTARDIVKYIASGQIKTLVCYDGFPGLSYNQVLRLADWYGKTQAFQRAVGKREGTLEEAVDTFFKSLAQPFEPVPNDAAIDTQVSEQWQYEDVAENIRNWNKYAT